MKLAEFLTQRQQLQHQDRTAAIAYFQKYLQNITEEDFEGNITTKVKVSLDLAIELIATKQPEQLQRAKVLIQQTGDLSNQTNQNSEISSDSIAYWLYAQAVLAMELGEWKDVLKLLQKAHDTYGINREGQSLVDDAIGRYYGKIGDYQAALMSFERSLSLRLEANDESAIGNSYALLGQLYLLTGESAQASSLFQSTLDIALTQSDHFLRVKALSGLVKVEIAESQWQSAIALIKDALVLLKEPIDSIEIGYLYCDLATALLGDRQIEESLICIRINVLPRFRDFQYLKGIAIAKHIRGRIYVHRLLEGLDSLDEDAIETAEDSLLDASISFEQFGMMHDYARALYDLACLYQLCSNSQFQYQYQGKSLRSLELALSILDQLGMSNSQLASQVEVMLHQVMRGSF